MKKTLTYFGASALVWWISTGAARADVASSDLHAKTLAQTLLNSLIFAAVGMLAVFLAVVIFDKATPRIDIQKELLNHNVAVAIVTGAVVIGVSIIVAAAIV